MEVNELQVFRLPDVNSRRVLLLRLRAGWRCCLNASSYADVVISNDSRQLSLHNARVPPLL